MSSSPKFFALALLALSGCGFTPLYGTPDGGANAGVAAPLTQIQVVNIPERTGQLLREALQDQLYAGTTPTTEKYRLAVNYNIGEQGIGILRDTAGTYNRFTATANWSLTPLGQPAGATPLTTGMASTQNAANVIDQQYFALTLETDTIDRQLADTLAQQISTQLAAYFQSHPAS